MAYLDSKGYCKKCKQVTPHRFSLTVKCHNCGLVSSQKEHRQAEKENEKN